MHIPMETVVKYKNTIKKTNIKLGTILDYYHESFESLFFRMNVLINDMKDIDERLDKLTINLKEKTNDQE